MRRKEKKGRFSAEWIADHCIAVRLRLLTRAVTRLYNDALRSHGITISQMNILVAVWRMREAKQGDVCRALFLEKSTLSRDVERMIARGWLKSMQGVDRRTGFLSITPAGQRLLEKTFPAWNRAQQQARALLREEDLDALNRAVRSLRSGNPAEPN